LFSLSLGLGFGYTSLGFMIDYVQGAYPLDRAMIYS
jgi:hypothetical protein